MTSLTPTINNRLAIGYNRLLTNLLGEVQRIPINTGLAIANIVLTLCTILIVALNALVLAVLEHDVVAGFTFRAETGLDACLAVLDCAVLDVAGFSTGEHLAADTTVILSVTGDVSIAAKAPACAPRILDDPLGLSVSY